MSLRVWAAVTLPWPLSSHAQLKAAAWGVHLQSDKVEGNDETPGSTQQPLLE